MYTALYKSLNTRENHSIFISFYLNRHVMRICLNKMRAILNSQTVEYFMKKAMAFTIMSIISFQTSI